MIRASHVPNLPQPGSPSYPFSKSLTYWIALLICLLVAAGCNTPAPDPGGNGDGGNGDGGNGDPTAQVGDCLSCHTNEALLKAVARDEPPPVVSTGEG
jgi:hypothetical protein